MTVKKRQLFCILCAAALLFAAPTARAAPEASRPESAQSYVSFDPFNISVVQKLRVRGMLQVEFGLDVPDDDLRERALMLNARLQDAYVQTLQFYSSHRVQLYYTPNVEEIALTLQAATDKVLGQTGAHVLLNQVMLHKPY
jgi:hypothetical protein